MYRIIRVSPKSISIILIIFSILIGCKKNDEVLETVTDDLHLGWHENMTGDIIFTEEYNGQDNDVCDQLKIINKDGIIDLQLPDSVCNINGIAWSPDKSKISFANSYIGIFSMGSDGFNTECEFNEHGCGRISFSSDGLSLVGVTNLGYLIMNLQSGDYDIINPPGGEWGPLTNPFYSVDWVPSRNRILYNKPVGPPNNVINTLYLWDISNNSCDKILSSAGYQTECSPDGQKIAFIKTTIFSNDSLNIGVYSDIYIADIDGSDSRLVLSFADNQDSVVCSDLTWSPNGDLIAVGSKNGIYVFNLEGSLLSKIPAFRCTNIDWK
jgi:Tol biopolymer transport system component